MENHQTAVRKLLPWNVIDDEIVISGIGGRYPESNSLDEFRDNLYNNVDMITSDDRRWPTDLYGITNRMGKLKEIDKFDASFFGIIPKVADEVDPQGRILLETTWEAIVDAGINPQTLRGSNTGVYVGYTSVAMPDGVPQEVQDDIQASKVESLLWFQGGSKAFYANRVSFLYDFHGPSMSIDIACASSMVCLDIAVTDLRLGKCDQAIVAGVSINLQPFTNHIYKVNNIAAPDGRSKVWDQEANGYVRGETVCSLFLQKKSDSKRIYATILHAKTNIDGYKLTGMFFPSTESQYDLMVATYSEAGIDPLEVNYFESHGTGTKAGDPQEAKAILEAYCKNRKGKLPIGLLKSNIGHGEGASGVASLSKLCIVYENKKIPANLNLKKIKTDIAVMVPPLDPVTANRDYEPGIVGINSFGIGGVNAHALTRPNKKECETPSIYSAGFPYRGSMLIKKSSTDSYQYNRKISKVENVKRPICFFFPGVGSQWSGMAKAMMNIDIFAAAIKQCADILKPFQLDLNYILLSEDPKAMEDKVHNFVAILSVQIALVDLFKALGVQPDCIVGHSFGEIACAYADGCLTLEQAIITSFWRGKAVKDSNIEHGMMAAVGLTWEETVKRCPPGVYAACHNSEDSVTISGSYEAVDSCVKAMIREKIFVKEVQCSNIPFHSPFLTPAGEPMMEALKKIITEPKYRSEKWISTSIPENEWSSDKARKASPEYFVNNLINPVLLHDATKHIPKNAIIIEVAAHTLFSAIFKRSMPNSDYVGLMRRGNNAGNLDFYFNSLGQLYQFGVNLTIKALYPQIEWPVPRNTQSIGSLIRWEHSKSFLVKKYPEYHSQATASDFVSKFSLSNPDDQFLKDHAFDGKCVLPATSYLLMAWRRLGVSLGQPWFSFPVIFENVEFKRLVPLSEDEMALKVRFLDPTGEFVILDGNNIAASGRIRRPDQIEFQYQNLIDNFEKENSSLSGHKLNTNEFYTEMNVRGYDYGPKFKQIQEIEFASFNRSRAMVRWSNNIITFVESMIQLSVAHTDQRFIYVASVLPSFKCDPRGFCDLPQEDLPVIIDANLKYVASRGIEMRGLKQKAIEIVDYNELEQYIEDCNTIALSIVLAGNKSSTQQFINKNVTRILNQKLSSEQVLLNILVDCFKYIVDENGNIIGDGILNWPTVQKIVADNGYDLSQDCLNTCHKNGRLIRSSLDIINENSLRNLTVVEANYNQQILIDDLMRHMNGHFHYPLVVDSLLLAKNISNLSDEIRNSAHKLVNWNAEESKLPAIEAPADLFIFRDSFDLDNLDFKIFAKEISSSVKENGFLFAVFRSNISKAEQMVHNFFGKSINTINLNQRIEQFENGAKAAGFNLISKKSDCITSTCLLFRKQVESLDPTKQITVPVYFGRFDEWVDKLKNSFTSYKNRPKNENIWMVSDDSTLNGILGMTNCLRQEPGGDRFRCIYSDTELPKPIDFNQAPYNEILKKDLSMNVFKDGQWGTYRLLDLERNYNTVESNEVYLDIVKKGDMSSIKWLVSPMIKHINHNDVNVQIHYAGLDLKDSLLSSGSMGIEFIERSLGTEFSGYRTDTGECVMGIAFHRAISTSIDIDPQLLIPIPDKWKLEDGAASINSLFIVWCSLIHKAHLQPGETILIHPGTSAIGLTTLQIANQMDCTIIATANTERKRRYLMENFDIPEKNILNPEDSDFIDQVLVATSYTGVDVVFNSFSNQKLHNLSPIVRDYGRYIDIDQPKSTFNSPLSSNAHYLNISSLICEKSFRNFMPRLMKNFRIWFDQYVKKCFDPIPQTIFDKDSFNQAFEVLNREENIGKVLIRIRDQVSIVTPSSSSFKIQAKPKTLFDSNKCYVLVGGLGGLGLEVAYWMAIRGARKLVLVSRSGIKNEYQYVFVKRIENAVKNCETVKVEISTSDPTSMKGAEQLIMDSEKIGPIGGLFHFATVLSDAFIEDQTPGSFKKVCAPKMNALGHLDVVTRKMCPELDYFVAFSSQSSARGFLGQNNYGYANSVMEHICEKRRRDGLPGQAIAYGPIGDVGLWAQNEHVDLTSIGMVIDTQRIPSCMEVLDRFLVLDYPIVTSIIRLETTQQAGNNSNAKDHIWQGIGIDMDSLPDNLSLGDVGMESILAVEMQQRIEREYEVVLTSDEIKKLTVGMIKEYRKADKETIRKSLTEFHNSK
ncbi:hypothetical protein DERF_016699 [Dermatophagoides farinae]|uniref:Fatty acid synthase n=1 Tax=Dermatophagoides farinae TaxID=6954 RepID=A0A922KSS4_DERFA|nr:hypothetical protein DERF_016699 [Dermatophagoides farinae]